jgi:hypothetical protein
MGDLGVALIPPADRRCDMTLANSVERMEVALMTPRDDGIVRGPSNSNSQKPEKF